MSCRWICERCSGSFFRSSTWDSHLHVCSWFHGVLQLIAATYDPARFAFFFDLARFAFNVSPRRVRENSRNIFVRLVLARAVPERIQWILTVLLKKRNFDRWIKRWRTVVPTANNYDRRNRFSTWWWIDVTFGRTSTVSYFCITWTVAKFEISFQRQNFPPEKYKYFTRF
jgi:hypothetical protein